MENSVTGKDMVYYLIDSFNSIWDSTVAFVHELYEYYIMFPLSHFSYIQYSPTLCQKG